MRGGALSRAPALGSFQARNGEGRFCDRDDAVLSSQGEGTGADRRRRSIGYQSQARSVESARASPPLSAAAAWLIIETFYEATAKAPPPAGSTNDRNRYVMMLGLLPVSSLSS